MQVMTRTRQSIQPLTPELANQIAAGEVIERPASVVKELLENAIDAGATQVDIEIQAGGTQLIRIRDNGHGIPEQELVLALSPHATSKIYSLDDLEHVTSMGFRGEALASIASVSELTLTSRATDMGTQHAWSITTQDGKFDLIPASHPQGTTVEVHNLFHTTPVRKRFLKAERTEFKHIEDAVKRIALANFAVAFNLKHNQRKIFSLPAALTSESQLERISRLTSKDFINNAISIEFENAGLKLTGWMATAGYSRSQSDMQFFFVNNRMIRDKVVTHAIRQAYQDKLYPGRFPVFVLNLTMDPQQVDVNVHPTKHEVRFIKSRLIHDFLYFSLHEALASAVTSDDQAKQSLSNNITPFPLRESYPEAGYQSSVSVQENIKAYSLDQDAIKKKLGTAITLLDNRYLVMRNQDGLAILDINLARQQLITHQLDKQEPSRLTSRPVLIPFTVSLAMNSDVFLKKLGEQLNLLGFEFDIAGEHELMVRAVPTVLESSELKSLLQEFISKLEADITAVKQIFIENVLTTPFTNRTENWNRFLRQLESEVENLESCFHQLDEKDFSRWFKPQ